MRRTGVFVCHCGLNIAGTIDVARVAAAAREFEGVVYSADYKYMCSDPGQNLIKQAIREHDLNGVVVCSCSPRMHEATFRKACDEGGLNGYLFEMGNIREQCSWVHRDREIATAKAINIAYGAVEKVRGDEPLAPIKIPITKRAMVIGAGISGMQTALDIAAGGHEVLLIDRQSAIGGHMHQLSETFPTLDCAQCTMTPKTVEVGQNPNIKLIMGAELESLDGVVGNFVAKVRQKPRYIDVSKCTGCGDCLDVCPVTIPDPFNKGMSKRKAIYKLSPQAVPNAFVIDKRGRAPCKDACPISQSAQGYVALMRQKKYDAAYRVIKDRNPFPGICGRVCNHRCEDSCTRGQVDQAVSIAAL
ncbi:MAG: NAD(P)-binding protein, partial [Chloroflexota bacterium]